MKNKLLRQIPRWTAWSLLVLAAGVSLRAAERYFGEPIALKGRAIYFTSWKYVRHRV